MDWLGLSLVVLSAGALALLARIRKPSAAKLRPVAGLNRLYRAFGLSVEDGTRLLLALGNRSLLTQNGGSALAGLGLLKEISKRASVSDRPPVAVAGEAALALLAQDTMHAGYRAIGAAEYYQPITGRLAGLTPFTSAAATLPILADEDVSVVALIGHFGVEAALMAEGAERMNVPLIGATDDPTAQSALYATSSEALIGEELFAAPAYFGGGRAPLASLTVQDALRWIIIIGMIIGAILKILALA